jgi:hypothetical protein
MPDPSPTGGAGADARLWVAATLFAGLVPCAGAWLAGTSDAEQAEGLMYGLLVAGPLWLWLCARAPLRAAVPRGLFVRLLAFALLGRLALLTVPPVLSEDLWRYLWDGAVLLGGGGPFDRAPADPALDAFASSHPALEGIRAGIGHAHLPTIYPPVAQWLFALFGLGGPSPLLWRLGVVAADLVVALGLARWAHARGDARTLALGWLACPLVAVESAVGAHVDVFGVAGLVWAGAFFAERRGGRAGWALAVAIGTKLFPAVVWLRLRGRALVFSGLGLGLATLPFLADAGHPGTALSTYAHRWRFNEGLFALLAAPFDALVAGHVGPIDLPPSWVPWARRLVGPGLDGEGMSSPLWPDEAAFAAAKALALVLLGLVTMERWVRADRTRPFETLFGPFTLTLMLVSPVVHPWYLLWLLPFGLLWLQTAPTRGLGRAVCLWVALVPLAYVPRIWALATGRWSTDGLWPVVEYVPVWIALALALRRGLNARNP